MLWAVKREIKREENVVYSLLNIFDIYMPLIYGEGRKKALIRLYKKIKEFLKNKSPVLPLALFSKYEDIFKRQKNKMSINLLYILILITQLMTLLGLCY